MPFVLVSLSCLLLPSQSLLAFPCFLNHLILILLSSYLLIYLFFVYRFVWSLLLLWMLFGIISALECSVYLRGNAVTILYFLVVIYLYLLKYASIYYLFVCFKHLFLSRDGLELGTRQCRCCRLR